MRPKHMREAIMKKYTTQAGGGGGDESSVGNHKHNLLNTI